MIISEEDYLEHYGTLHKSGRYPWGSGGEEMRSKDFLNYVDDLKRQGLSQTEISRGLKISTTQLRARRTIARNEEQLSRIAMAQRLKDKALSNVAIGERMNLNESSVRALLAPGAKEKAQILNSTADMLKRQVAEKKYVDVGSGVENHLHVSETKLRAAVAVLVEQGYSVHPVNIPTSGGHENRLKVLVPPGVTQKETWLNRDKIQQVSEMSGDGGRSYFGLLPPMVIHPDRVSVRYGDQGGSAADGVIFVRPGIEDLSLGKARYAQVRIAVGPDHYLKGMAMYKEGLPDGVDLLFNTNKKDTGNKLDALKPVTGDKDNPFGAVVDQLGPKDEHGRLTKVTSAMNLVNEEGDWSNWSKSLASQVLSKQSPTLAKSQLNMTFEDRRKEFGEILSLTNPTVRKKLLRDFSDATDSASVHLKAARLPRQGWHAILPINSLPPGEIYAPNFRNGERVVLIRYPHGGIFEIPELTVNNNHPESNRLLKGARDAVGIHHSVAERLSGADFDGDAVLVIPNDSRKIKTAPALEGLKGFDPRSQYSLDASVPRMTPRQKGAEMGAISNLITDMTIRGANTTDLAAALRHSMVVIDAENHHLDYKRSAKDNGIRNLKQKYQGRTDAGASTLISRAGAKIYLPDRKPRTQAKGGPIDKTTGAKVYEPTGRINYKTGAIKEAKFKRLAEAEDAHALSSGTPIERLYADHSNRLKAMANSARLEMINTPPLKYSPSAKRTYHVEVASLNAKLALAIRNRPLERQAQILANAVIKAKQGDNPNMDDASFKRMKFQALEEARLRTGAKKQDILITQSEWNAIQAGAISDSKLGEILDKADIDVVRQLATPRRELKMTTSKTARAQTMLASGYTRAEVASALGVSVTTLDTATNQ